MFQSRFKMKIDFDSVMHHSKTSFVSISYLFNRIGYCQTKMNFITKNITNILFLNWSKKREKRKEIYLFRSYQHLIRNSTIGYVSTLPNSIDWWSEYLEIDKTYVEHRNDLRLKSICASTLLLVVIFQNGLPHIGIIVCWRFHLSWHFAFVVVIICNNHYGEEGEKERRAIMTVIKEEDCSPVSTSSGVVFVCSPFPLSYEKWFLNICS